MSTKNEELIAEARDRVINLRDYEPGEYDSDFEAAWEESASIVERLTDALEAAIKPVTVNTVEELDALPLDSVILLATPHGPIPAQADESGWLMAGGPDPITSAMIIERGGSVVVLHTPRQEGSNG